MGSILMGALRPCDVILPISMSLGIVVEGPEGIVLAAESRVTLTAQTPTGPLYVNFDNATKVLAFHN